MEGTRNEAQSVVFYFAHGFLGQYIPHSLSEICADNANAGAPCADTSVLGLKPGITTFRDKTPTLPGSKVLHLFIGLTAYFSFWMGIATS